MRALIVVAFCTMYSVQAWNENIGPIHVETQTGALPPKYYPLNGDDKHATRKAGTFVKFIKIVPQLNPLRLPTLGPYNVAVPEINFLGDLHLSNIIVNGLKTLSLPHLEVRMAPSRIDFNASLPQITADGNENIGPIHVETQTGALPPKYYPLTGDDKNATRKAGTLVNFIKTVPQLNPLRLPSLGPYNVAVPEINFLGDLYLSNIIVNGLKTLSLPHLEVRMAPVRIDFNASLPQVTADVNFELQAVLGNQPINVHGQLSASLQDLVLSAAVGPKIAQAQSNQVYHVDSADVNIDLKNLQLQLNVNQYAEDFRTILIQFLRNTQQYSKIVDDILRAVLKAISHELTQVTAKEILQYLLGSSRLPLSG